MTEYLWFNRLRYNQLEPWCILRQDPARRKRNLSRLNPSLMYVEL